MKSEPEALYKNRLISKAYPKLDELAHNAFSTAVQSRHDDTARLNRLNTYLSRLVDMESSRHVLVLGCGPHPQPISILAANGHSVIGVEPVESFVNSANEFLTDNAVVLQGAAESIPLEYQSQDIVYFESVIEHVDSIRISLSEIYRVLKPNGILYLSTTNRHKFSLTGTNGEYNIPFYNWMPRLLKESYIHHHLHFRPSLANYTERPAVHWFTYQDLFAAGRDSGFARFYSLIDLMRPSDESIKKSSFRQRILKLTQQNPLVRSLALSQMSGHIIMWKRG